MLARTMCGPNAATAHGEEGAQLLLRDFACLPGYPAAVLMHMPSCRQLQYY